MRAETKKQMVWKRLCCLMQEIQCEQLQSLSLAPNYYNLMSNFQIN